MDNRTRWSVTKAHLRAIREVVQRNGLLSTIRSGWLSYRIRLWWQLMREAPWRQA
jgi:hypothetical protein